MRTEERSGGDIIIPAMDYQAERFYEIVKNDAQLVKID